MLSSFEQLKDFDPSQHWLSFEESWVPEAAQFVYTPYIVEKPTGIIGYIIRLVYEYIWKPESLQLASVVPKFHDYTEILCTLQESGALRANEMEIHQVAARVYRFFHSKCGQRRDLISGPDGRDVFLRLNNLRWTHQGHGVEDEADAGLSFARELHLTWGRYQLESALEPPSQGLADTLFAVDPSRFNQIESRLDTLMMYVEPGSQIRNLRYRAGFFPNSRVSLSVVQGNFRNLKTRLREANACGFGPLGGGSRVHRLQLAGFVLILDRFEERQAELRESLAPQEAEALLKEEITQFFLKAVELGGGCVNLRSTGIEDLYCAHGKPEMRNAQLREKVVSTLEELRRRMLTQFITANLGQGDHASTINGYKRSLGREFGLSNGISDYDSNHTSYAAGGLTGAIRQQFNREYTPQKIISYLSSIIDGQSRDITVDQFRAWVVHNLLGGDESRQAETTTSDGKFKPQVIAQMLVNFGIFSTTDLVRSAGA